LKRLPKPAATGAPNGGERSAAAPSAAAPADTAERHREGQFEKLVQAVRDYAIISLDVEGRITTWNEGAERITGYRAEEAMGRPVSIFYPPEAITRGWPGHELATAAAAGRFEDEGWRLRKDGTRFWANVVVTALRDDAGEVEGYSKIFRDLTARRLEEEELRTSEERFRLLIEGVRDYGIFMLDPDGRVASWNLGAERLKGYRPSEIIGKHFSIFYPAEVVASGWPERELEGARANGRFEDEGWRIRKDGSRFWASVVITALRNSLGELVGFSKITRDLTERRRHEEELRQSEERFRLLVDAVQDYAIFMLEPTGVVASWNAGAERIKGYRPEEIIGRHFSVFYPPEKVAEGWPEHELKVAAATGRFEDVGWRIRKDGSRFWANVVINAVRGPAGELRGFAKVTRDLTEARRVQQLEEEGRQMSEFLAMLGHELRNPLAPIRNAVALMQTTDVADPTILWARELIERQVGHMSRLVEDLLDVSRITSGKITLRPEVMDLRSVVSRSVDANRAFFEARKQAVDVDLGPAPVPVEGDPTRLAQVALNLLTNAAKYTPEGGHVWVSVRKDGGEAELKVRDDGVGMKPELLPRVFELFVQGERTLDRSEGGLGLGLTMVQRLVALHHGRVEARSAGLGLGSEFVIHLPLAAASGLEAADRATGRPDAGDDRRLRILVVDDNRDSAESTYLLLSNWGHDVETAHDGAGALAAVERSHPDIVLLDIGLPGIDGYEVARRIRATAAGANTALVAMTGYGQADDRRRSSEAGFTMHLVKPVEPGALKRVVAELAPRG
jgi:PAS domain S-box-containing protein